MDAEKVLLPGESPQDPYVKEIDEVAFHIDRVRTYLTRSMSIVRVLKRLGSSQRRPKAS
jgi:hypothetical protein